jgi:hypothetical protein
MHSRNINFGKAFQRPFLLFSLLFLALDNEVPAQNIPIIRNTDPTEYIQRIELTPVDRPRIWDTVCEFASQLKCPEKVENMTLIDKTTGKITTQFGFYLYHQMAFLKQVEGAVFADLVIEFKQGQVVAAIRNIYFMDYTRDRYGKFSPKSSKRYSLEELDKKRKNDSWREHSVTIDENMRMLLSNMYHAILDIKSASVH